MSKSRLKSIKLGAGFLLYVLMILFISSYFDLGISTEVLLKTLKSNLLMSVFFGAILVAFNEWALKKVRNPGEE